MDLGLISRPCEKSREHYKQAAPLSPPPTGAWSWQVVAIGNHLPARAEGALTELCRDYWPPLYAFVRRRGYSPHDAEDLTQAFFAYLIESKAYARADREEGKFRTFLLVVLKRFLSGARDREQRIKRGGGQQFVFLDQDLAAVEARCASGLPNGEVADEERLFRVALGRGACWTRHESPPHGIQSRSEDTHLRRAPTLPDRRGASAQPG